MLVSAVCPFLTDFSNPLGNQAVLLQPFLNNNLFNSCDEINFANSISLFN